MNIPEQIPSWVADVRTIALEGRIAALERRDAELAGEVDRVRSDLQALRAAMEAPDAAAMTPGEEETAAPGEVADAVVEAWRLAPLGIRLACAAMLLGQSHALAGPLQEAIALEDLRVRGKDLENWLETYPAHFADAVGRTVVEPPKDPSPAEHLAVLTLGDARSTLGACLSAAGVEWLRPAAGAGVGTDSEVVGEEPGEPAGTVARVLRPGLLVRGVLKLPARVARRSGRAVGDPAPASDGDAPLEKTPAAAGEDPGWLRRLKSAAFGRETEAVSRHLGELERLVRAALDPTVPVDEAGEVGWLLGPRYAAALEGVPAAWREAFEAARGEMLAWLAREAGVEVVEPAVGVPFDARTMRSEGKRRTVHAQEVGCVARVETAGLARGGAVVMPARVVVYDSEGDA